MKFIQPKYITRFFLTLCCGMIFYGTFYNLIHEGDYMDIKVPNNLYPELSQSSCKGYNTSYKNGSIVFFENEKSYDSFKCVNLFMSYYIWKGVSTTPKIVNQKINGCLDFDNVEYDLGVVKKQSIRKNYSYTYECKQSNNIKYWEVINHEI